MKNKKISPDDMKQFVLYFFAGGTAAVVEWLVFYVVNVKLQMFYIIATVISFIIATFVNFILGKYIVFKKTSQAMGIKEEVFLVYLISLLGLILNILFMWMFVHLMNIHPMLAKICSTGLIFFFNFFSRKMFVYKAN